MTQFDLGIFAGRLLAQTSRDCAVEKNVFVGIRSGKITDVRVDVTSASVKSLCAQFVDAGDQLLMPSLINGHTHLPMSLFRGLAEDLPFWDWLTQVIFPVEGQLLNEDLVRVGTRLALWESLQSGVTTFCDMYYFADAVADEVDRAGLRGVVGEAVADFPTPDDKAQTGEGYKRFEAMAKRFKSHDRIVPAIAPHAPYTCGDATLTKCRDLARTHGAPTLIHVQETAKEVTDSEAQFKKTPTERLYDLGLMGPATVFAHGVHLNANDMKLVADTKTSVVYNPESNMKLGSGMANLAEWKRLGIRAGLGTDGAASNNDLNLFSEMDTGTKLQKLRDAGASAIGARDLLWMATQGGAEALGLGDRVGSIEVGKAADLILVSLSEAALQPIYDLPVQLVYSASGVRVRSVVCGGQVIVDDGEFKTLDLKALRQDVEAWRSKIAGFLKKDF